MKTAETIYPDTAKYLRDFATKSAELRVPLTGSMDLTYRCNLRCIHCYAGGVQTSELDTGRIMPLLDEICDAGCLYLLLSGGEPLLHPEFPEIYRYAKEKGLLVTVFSNGTLISESCAGLFKELPPRMVEISLYGATRKTYETITRVAGSYQKCLSGINTLLNSGVHVRLKTVLMTSNSHEFYEMEDMARNFGVKFRFDAGIFPRLNGDSSPLSLRVSPAEAVDKEFSDVARIEQWRRFLDHNSTGSLPDSLYQCGAGVTGFHIAPSGHMQPCLMTSGISYDLAVGSFSEGWKDITSRIRARKSGHDSACNKCEMKLHCSYCPAFFELENGNADQHSAYICAMGRNRYANLCTKGASDGK